MSREDWQDAVRTDAHDRDEDWHEQRAADETTAAEHWADVARDERAWEDR